MVGATGPDSNVPERRLGPVSEWPTIRPLVRKRKLNTTALLAIYSISRSSPICREYALTCEAAGRCGHVLQSHGMLTARRVVVEVTWRVQPER